MNRLDRRLSLVCSLFLLGPGLGAGLAHGQPDQLSGGEYALFTSDDLRTTGLVGSYVDQSLRNYRPHDDWRETQVVAGSRIDRALDFTDSSWGERAEVGLTNGTDENWEDFSVQWDGYIQIITDGMSLATISDDGSRMWIDLNDDGTFDETGPEFVNNNWGSGQAATLGPPSDPVPAGLYRIRVQYEEGFGGNVLQLVSPAPPTVRVAYLIPSNRSPQATAVANLEQTMLRLHQWSCEQMDRNGFGPAAFRYETALDSVTPIIYVVDLAETDAFLRGDIWNRVNQAAANAGVPIWTPGEVWVLIPEIHEQLPDGSIVGGVALGASFGSGNDPGVAMVGSALLSLANAKGLTNDTPYNGLIIPEIGRYPLVQSVSFPWFEGSTISSIVSSFVGALMHEASHALGLGHDFRNDANFHGNLMFNGLRGIRGAIFPTLYPQDDARLSYAAALALSTSRYMVDCELMPPPPGPAHATHPPDTTSEGPPRPRNRWRGADDQPPPFGTVTPAGASDAPALTILTSGDITPVDGHVEIQFEASDETGLALALLRWNGETIGELPLSGTTVSQTFATVWYEPGEVNNYSISAYDGAGNRRDAQTAIVPADGFNRGPRPFFKIAPSQVVLGDSTLLTATGTGDPDDGSSGLLFEWDIDGDGSFDTPPVSETTLTVEYDDPGRWLVRVRVTDPSGSAPTSTPIAVRIWPTSACPADLDGNGTVGVEDLLALLAAWGTDPGGPPDLNGDGIVDTRDLLALLASWGPCPG